MSAESESVVPSGHLAYLPVIPFLVQDTKTRSLRPNAEFQLRKPPVWPRFSNSKLPYKYTVTGGLQYCGHLRPAPEGSVRWYAQRASSMCMCMSPRARWKMVHCSYLYMLSVSVMQAGVTLSEVLGVVMRVLQVFNFSCLWSWLLWCFPST